MDVQAKSWLSDCDPYKSTGILRGLAPPLTPMMRRSHPRCATLEPTVTDKGRRGVRRFLDVAAAVDERSSISVSQAGLPSLVRDHAHRQHSPLPRLSPRSPKAPADGYELRQIGDGSWLSIPIPSPVVSPRLSPIRGREAQLTPFLSRQAFVAEYESLTQERRRALGARQAEAAAEAAAAQAARDAAANARAQERRRLMAEVEQMKSQASARVVGMDESGAQSPDSPSRLRGWHEECTTPTGIPRRSASEGKRTARRLSRQRRRAAAQKADEEAGEEARERAAERTGGAAQGGGAGGGGDRSEGGGRGGSQNGRRRVLASIAVGAPQLHADCDLDSDLDRWGLICSGLPGTRDEGWQGSRAPCQRAGSGTLGRRVGVVTVTPRNSPHGTGAARRFLI